MEIKIIKNFNNISYGIISSVNAALYGPQGQDTDPIWNNPLTSCNGRLQSPINLPLSGTAAGDGPIHFDGYKDQISGIVYNAGFTLAMFPNRGTNVTISKGGLPNTFNFVAVMFHWPSEHTINGASYPLEAQLLHINSKYSGLFQAESQPDGIGVISVLFHLSNRENRAINLILNSGRGAFTTLGRIDPLITGIRLADLLPRSRCSYYRYRGSDTTPFCRETFIWNVFSETLPITESQVAKFRTLVTNGFYQAGGFLRFNSRPTKPVNGRLITYEKSPVCRTGSSFRPETIPWILRPFVKANRI